MEKVLVTGAAGYIGSHVVSVLLDMGYDVMEVQQAQDPRCLQARSIPAPRLF